MDRLLTVDQAGELLNTGPRFVRRLIAERRIGGVMAGALYERSLPIQVAAVAASGSDLAAGGSLMTVW